MTVEELMGILSRACDEGHGNKLVFFANEGHTTSWRINSVELRFSDLVILHPLEEEFVIYENSPPAGTFLK